MFLINNSRLECRKQTCFCVESFETALTCSSSILIKTLTDPLLPLPFCLILLCAVAEGGGRRGGVLKGGFS